MPYIKPSYRLELDELIVSLTKKLQSIPEQDRAGTLNYTVTRLLHSMCVRYNLDLHEPPQWNYRAINEVAGVLKCVHDEFYRVVVAPYEDEKMTQNGQILEFSLLPSKRNSI